MAKSTIPKTDEPQPIQPVENPILCSPYKEPTDYWKYDRQTGEASHGGTRRPAGYYYKEQRTGSAQKQLFVEETRDDLPLVNALRQDVRRWREAGYRGASTVTRQLLAHWADSYRREKNLRRLFFCQREAVETVIYLAELRMPGRSSRTGFKNFELSDDDLGRLLRGERTSFVDQAASEDFQQTLIDRPRDADLRPLVRLGCKMATGSGKTVVMSMLIAWAFCNRGKNPGSRQFPNAVLVCCPNLTVKERLQVLRPDYEGNYFTQFDLVPEMLRMYLNQGKVRIENWHGFYPESEHKEGDRTYTVVDKGPETPEVFAKRVLGDLADRMPILVLNDEGHHCWRKAPDDAKLATDEKKRLEDEAREATVWVEGLDRINNAIPGGGISFCVDLSATPFYIKGSGHPEGRPFPWLVNDFGLVDAIESGIVKIPRLPVSDTTGRPDPAYFKLWEHIKSQMEPGDFLPGKARRPKPEVVWDKAQGALLQLYGQWKERFEYYTEAESGQERIPPVMIVVCDNTEIAEYFYRGISGEQEEEEEVTESDIEAVQSESNGMPAPKAGTTRTKSKPKKRTVYNGNEVMPELANQAGQRNTIRIDSKLLAEAESDDPSKKKQKAAEELRRLVATVGQKGEPGEQIRCVVSVSMLTEGWDANNVTDILGIRAFDSQLLCEQVVGRGLRRINYDPEINAEGNERLRPEYVDVYGIPFSVIPYKGRTSKQPAPEDRPDHFVHALPERAGYAIQFPVVEGYAFALEKNQIRCDWSKMERTEVEPNREPTATFITAAAGQYEGVAGTRPPLFDRVEQNRNAYYNSTHPQRIAFEIAKALTQRLAALAHDESADMTRRVFRLQSRHTLFPQVYAIVERYLREYVDFRGVNPGELGLLRYATRIVELLSAAIEADSDEGEPLLMPILNRNQEIGTTADVAFTTKRKCRPTTRSHIDQVVLDTETWEASAAFALEAATESVAFYARNDHLGFTIPYEFEGHRHNYEPDFLVRLHCGLTLVLEVKGHETQQTRAKHQAARTQWIRAVNNWGRRGIWDFDVCRDPQQLRKRLEIINDLGTVPNNVATLDRSEAGLFA